MTTALTRPKTSRQQINIINVRIETTHAYLAEDSEFKNVIQDITAEYIEGRQDQLLARALEKSTRLDQLDTLFLSKI